MNKKMLIIPAVLLSIGLVAVSARQVLADDSGQHPFATQLAERFGLNVDDVSAFMREVHQGRHEEMEARHEELLNGLVNSGKLTAEQAQLIQEHHEEMQAEREANLEEWQNLTPEERRTKMEEHRAEMEAWASENGIDLSAIHGDGFGPEHSMKGRRGW